MNHLFFENRFFNLPIFLNLYLQYLFGGILLEINVLKPLKFKISSIFDRTKKNLRLVTHVEHCESKLVNE